MGLKDLKKFGSDTVETPGGTFPVRGLHLDDIKAIMRVNNSDIDALVKKSAELPFGEDGQPEFSLIIAQAIHSAPRLIGHIISRASGDEDDEDAISIARTLPLDVQVDAIDKIGKLTFSMTGGPKKVIEIVMRIAQGSTNLAKDLNLSNIG